MTVDEVRTRMRRIKAHEMGSDYQAADAARRRLYEDVLGAIRGGNIYYKELAEEALGREVV